MESIKTKATLTMGEGKKLTLRLFLSQSQKEDFILEKGKQPSNMINIVIL